MKKKNYARLFLSIGMLTIVSTTIGCGSSVSTELVYPDFPTTPNELDSWEYFKDENGKVESWELEWYINDTNTSWNSFGTDRVSQILQETTGVNIKFINPVTDDGQKLATLISSNKLPDLVSIQSWYPQCSQLASQGYLYPLDGLIERWAPSFTKRIQQDIWEYFRQGDGYTYGIPNFAYSNQYVSDDDKLPPNGCILVREDWYKEVEALNIDMTTTKGFIEGCTYIKEKYEDSIPFQLSPFTNEGNMSVEWLAQYFATPFEDKNGNYVDVRTHERYKEMLGFLNECNAKGLILPRNFSDKAEQIKTLISRGNVFVSAVTPQDYQQAFMNCYNRGINYIPLVLKNKDNETPVLQDLSGNGYLLTMVSKNCKRPDKVIKLLDFLYSEEGQRLIAFGVEGETYVWNEDHTKILWTDRYIRGINEENQEDLAWVNSYGLYQMTLLMNLAYINKVKPMNGRRPVDIYIDNMKRPMTPYAYNYKPTFLKHDTASDEYFQISTKATRIDTKWSEALVKIIRSENYLETYNESIAYANRQGLDDVIKFYSESYQNTKKVLKIEKGWPQYKDNYQEPVTGPNGDFSYWVGATHD